MPIKMASLVKKSAVQFSVENVVAWWSSKKSQIVFVLLFFVVLLILILVVLILVLFTYFLHNLSLASQQTTRLLEWLNGWNASALLRQTSTRNQARKFNVLLVAVFCFNDESHN